MKHTTNSIPSYVRLTKGAAGKNDGMATMLCSLNLEHDEPKEDIREVREQFYEDYFGIPSLAQQMGRLASDMSYSKRMKEKPQSFVGEYEFLSNMYLCSVIIKTKDGEEMAFPSAENAFQAMKCKTRKEMEQFQTITPYEAKKLGAKVELRSNWVEIRDKVMKTVLRAKFEDQELAIQLLKTDDMALCEKNYWNDQYWGKTVGQEEIEISGAAGMLYKTKHFGENKLGKMLCEIRQEIRDSHAYDLYLGTYAEQADINVDWLGKC